MCEFLLEEVPMNENEEAKTCGRDSSFTATGSKRLLVVASWAGNERKLEVLAFKITLVFVFF